MQASALGLIPARAGNTANSRRKHQRAGAHPRSRGEHRVRNLHGDVVTGSSPLARGTLPGGALFGYGLGLIPARAGNTWQGNFFPAGRWAHPRSRGEHSGMALVCSRRAGSSPLARGTLVPDVHQHLRDGLIPARAGNTLADMGFYPLHQQNRITLKPEPTSRIHDK